MALAVFEGHASAPRPWGLLVADTKDCLTELQADVLGRAVETSKHSTAWKAAK